MAITEAKDKTKHFLMSFFESPYLRIYQILYTFVNIKVKFYNIFKIYFKYV